MRITEIKVLPVEGDEKLKAHVTLKFNDCFIVRYIKVIHGTKGYFVAMPAKRLKEGTYRDLAHPLDRHTRQMIEEEVMFEFKKAFKGSVPPQFPEPRFTAMERTL